MTNPHGFDPELHEHFMMDPYYIDNIEARCKQLLADWAEMSEVDKCQTILESPTWLDTISEAEDVLAAITTNKAKWINTMGSHAISLPPYSYPDNVRNIKSSEITLK